MRRFSQIKWLFAGIVFSSVLSYSQSSGSTPPPPPVCSASNAGALYTDTGTSPATVYTCSYYNLAYQWVVNPSYGGLVYYPTVPSTCSGALPMFLSGYPSTNLYVCVNGAPTLVKSGSGPVTSVGLSLPSDFIVTGSPVISNGTLTAVRASQLANLFLASPNGASGVPSYRAILPADIPTLNQNTTGTSSNVTGIVAPANGGTGVASPTGYAYGNGASNFTFSSTIPYSALSGTPTIPTSADWPNAGTCTAGQYVDALANGTTPTCAQVAYSQLSGTPTIPTSADWPNAGTCTAGQYVDALTNGTIPTCAQVAYSQISGTPSSLPTPNSVTFNSSGGAAPGASFNGSSAVTVDYHTVGADVSGSAAARAGTGACAANQFEYVDTTTGPTCAQVAYSQLSGTPTIPTSADWPNAGTCTAGQYVDALANGTTPTCAQVAYSQLSGTPTIPTSADWPNAGSCPANEFVNALTNGAAPTCASPAGSGTVNSGTAGQLAWYSATGTAVSGNSHLDDGATETGAVTSTEVIRVPLLQGNSTAAPVTFVYNNTQGGATITCATTCSIFDGELAIAQSATNATGGNWFYVQTTFGFSAGMGNLNCVLTPGASNSVQMYLYIPSTSQNSFQVATSAGAAASQTFYFYYHCAN